jgi:hypothetical protein
MHVEVPSPSLLAAQGLGLWFSSNILLCAFRPTLWVLGSQTLALSLMNNHRGVFGHSSDNSPKKHKLNLERTPPEWVKRKRQKAGYCKDTGNQKLVCRRRAVKSLNSPCRAVEPFALGRRARYNSAIPVRHLTKACVTLRGAWCL